MAGILMVHINSVKIADGRLTVDRKFHLGMLEYVSQLGRVTTVNPSLREGHAIMDPIELPIRDLPYDVASVNGRDDECLARHIANSTLVYSAGLGSAEIAKSLEVPYIQILEYDLDTELRIIGSEVGGLRRAVRSARRVRDWWLGDIRNMRGAHSLHCNGYPIFDVARVHNANRLLYLDSRMGAEDIITAEALSERLKSLSKRPLRLLYSGRYERMKGADDVVRVAVECLRRGMNVELDCYGHGSLAEKMTQMANGDSRIRIHGSIPYPQLVKLAQGSDVFLCCHIQNDPSCTYLDSMGAALPIVGYGNRMWKRLKEESKAGISVKMGSISQMVTAIRRLIDTRLELDSLSYKARQFALAHAFECEFGKRISALKVAARN